MLPVVHAYTAAPEPVIETLYHEGFHAHQMEHFSPIPDARPAMGPRLDAVRLQGATPAEYEALAEAERKALSAALAAPGEDSLRAVLRGYLSTRARRMALAPEVQRVERWEEQNEGTAQYVGQLCAASAVGAGREHARARVRMRLSQPSPALHYGRPSKWRAYGVGAALALLLDDLGARDWQRAVTAGTALDALLLEQLYAPEPGS
jgi:hypothetical protein